MIQSVKEMLKVTHTDVAMWMGYNKVKDLSCELDIGVSLLIVAISNGDRINMMIHCHLIILLVEPVCVIAVDISIEMSGIHDISLFFLDVLPMGILFRFIDKLWAVPL